VVGACDCVVWGFGWVCEFLKVWGCLLCLAWLWVFVGVWGWFFGIVLWFVKYLCCVVAWFYCGGLVVFFFWGCFLGFWCFGSVGCAFDLCSVVLVRYCVGGCGVLRVGFVVFLGRVFGGC